MDSRTKNKVAIKVIDRGDFCEPEQLELLKREVAISRKLKHPNIVNLLDVVFEDDLLVMVMELANGGHLYQRVSDMGDRKKLMPEKQAQYFFKQMISAVEYCHSCGVWHRDLKLENIVLASKNKKLDIIKVTDFGASKDSSRSLPKTNVRESFEIPRVLDIMRCCSVCETSSYQSFTGACAVAGWDDILHGASEKTLHRFLAHLQHLAHTNV